MDLTWLIWKIQSICNAAHSSSNPKRTNKLEAQLAPLPKPKDIFPRWHLQQHQIPYVKLEVQTLLISVTLLSDLRYPQSIVHLLNQLSGVNHHLNASHDPMTNLAPTNQGPAPPPIQHLKWWSIYIGMITVIVGELHQWKESILTPSKIQHTSLKHILERLEHLLALAIGLRVVWRTKMQLSTQTPHKTSSKT